MAGIIISAIIFAAIAWYLRTREKTEETVISEDRACMEEEDWDLDSGSSAYGFGIGMCGISMLTSMLTDITYAYLPYNIYHDMFDSSLDDNSWLSNDDDDSFSACDDSWSSSFDDD
ncbi:MAG: hypothetical protein CVU73_07375 [Deltaproteobacteria bacterium HGW-Deltaproteobacteria-8]|jgi:hypothetical protein|nr:MAG: hypothetical protein CVU73_07375 [Deltaproteobacteria bacterium HGW-Deltaproteobacteria-8]